MSRQDCSICCQTLAKSKFIKCLYCNEEACRYCHQTYIKDQPEDNCMFCNKRWNIEFMYENFTASFMKKDYKDVRAELLFEREKALLPQTQKEMEISKKIRDNTEKIMGLQADNGFLKHTESDRFMKLCIKQMISMVEYKKNIDIIIQKIEKNMEKIEELRALNAVLNLQIDNPNEIEEKKEPVYPCSVSECRGFLSQEGHKLVCGICKARHCISCRTKADDEHKCNKETLETIKLLDKETKPCPKCHIPIYKTSGCDQMWCVKCHTAFSWNTGQIESGHIHNPHYWQYMQTQGRDLEAVRRMNNPNREGADCIDLDDVVRATGSARFASICTLLMHLRYGEYNYHEVRDYISANRDIRREYLLNKLSLDKFKKEIYKREKRRWYNIEMRQIFTMVYDSSKDLIINAYQTYAHTQEYIGRLRDALGEVNKIVEYAIDQNKSICNKYGYVCPNSASCTYDSLLKYTSIHSTF